MAKQHVPDDSATRMLVAHTSRRAIAMGILFPFLRPQWAGKSVDIVQSVGVACLLGFTPKKKLGSGVFGETFLVQHPTPGKKLRDTRVVMKSVLLNRPETGFHGGLAMFNAEVACALVASRLGLGPKLHHAWRCGDSGFVVMEQCVPLGKTPLLSSKRDVADIALGVFLFADFGLIHNDLHTGNIMRHRETFRPVIIDYGMATTITASSGYDQLMQLKAQYHLDTASAATVLTMLELYDDCRTPRPPVSAMMAVLRRARADAAKVKSATSVGARDIEALAPNARRV